VRVPGDGGIERADVEAAAGILRAGGVETDVVDSNSSEEAWQKARLAVGSGYDTVFACGGDGTVHDVIQGLVHTPVALGILPLGTANVLAHDLRLPKNAVAAARAALAARVKRIGVGQVSYVGFDGRAASRYFTVTAGIGVDAHLFYRLNAGVKKRLGMISYYAKATQLWLTDPLHTFAVEYGDAASGERKQVQVSELLAVRANYFGGVLQELAPGASLDSPHLRLVVFRTRSRLLYLAYIIRGIVRLSFAVPGIDLVDSDSVECRVDAGEGAKRVFVEVDGELVGMLPAILTMVPNALNLLAP
jgi:diacylglycerol kinase family enzyme